MRLLALLLADARHREHVVPLGDEPASLPRGVSLPEILRVALDGGPLPRGVKRVVLEVEAGGDRFVVERGAACRLVRVAGQARDVVADDDAYVTEFLARLSSSSEPLARRAIARPAEVARALEADVTGERAGALHGAIVAELAAASAALGGRMRDLLRRAQGVLDDATESLEPGRDRSLTPDDLAALREEVVARLGQSADAAGKLDQAFESASALAERLRQRRARVDEFLRVEQIERKLERQRHLMRAERERLERARAAADLQRPDAAGGDPARAERAARQRAEGRFEEARAALTRARLRVTEYEAGSAEREAIAAWIQRLEDTGERLERARTAAAVLATCRRDAERLEARERQIDEEMAAAAKALDSIREGLAAGDAAPEDAARARADAAQAARLAEDVRRVSAVRERLRDQARAVQVAKLELERAEEALETAQREHEWNRSSPHPRDVAELPSVPELVAARAAAERAVTEAGEGIHATREELRQRTAALGTTAYVAPELLEAEARERAQAAARFGGPVLDRATLERRAADLEARQRSLSDEKEATGREIGELSLAALAARQDASAADDVPETLREPRAVETALDEARRELATRLAARDAALAELAAAESAAAEADDELRRARSREESAGRRLVDIASRDAPLRDAGFASWDEVEAAMLAPEAMAALEHDLREHETLERLVEDGRRASETDMLLPRADPAQAELMQALVAHAREASASRRDRLVARLADVDRWLDALDEVVAELEAVELAAGLGEGSAPAGGTFEERVAEALARRVLARAEGRLLAWHRPWSLAWGGEPGQPRPLVVRDAETGAVLPAEDVLAAAALPLALAVETAAAGEPVDLSLLVLEGWTHPVPPSTAGPMFVPA